MNKKHDDEVPNEIPTKKLPHNTIPVKDPSNPDKDNPVNPKTDDSVDDNNQDNNQDNED